MGTTYFKCYIEVNLLCVMIHLLIFILQNENDDPMKLINKKNQFSSIIIVWSKEDARKYYIDVKECLISVSIFAPI